jgi:hypothetical protein
MPRLANRLLPALLLVSIAPAAAVAQACLGNGSFAGNHLQMNAAYVTVDEVDEVGASFVSGSNSVFAGLGVSSYSIGDGSSSVRIGGTLGYQVPVSTSGRVQVCPVLSATVGLPSDDFGGTGNEYRTQSFGFGVAVGGTLLRAERFALVPSLSAGVQRDVLTVGGLPGADIADTYGTVGLALGFLFNDALSLRPSIRIPIGATFDDPVYGIGVSLNYGGRR